MNEQTGNAKQGQVEELKSERVQEELASRKRRLPRPDDEIGAAMMDLAEQLG